MHTDKTDTSAHALQTLPPRLDYKLLCLTCNGILSKSHVDLINSPFHTTVEGM